MLSTGERFHCPSVHVVHQSPRHPWVTGNYLGTVDLDMLHKATSNPAGPLNFYAYFPGMNCNYFIVVSRLTMSWYFQTAVLAGHTVDPRMTPSKLGYPSWGFLGPPWSPSCWSRAVP